LFGDIGFNPYRPQVTKTIALVESSAPAGRFGLQVGDEIIKLDGTPMNNWRQIVEYIEPRATQNVDFEVLRESTTLNLMITLGTHPSSQNGELSKGYLGVSTFQEAWPKEYVIETKLGPVDAFFEGVDSTWRLMTTTLKMLGKLVTGDLSIKTLSGPISIAEGAGNHASAGLIAFLGFLALISVNLGIINLLPLPILDGGHLLYFTIELITGKPVSESVQEVGFKIGAAVLFIVMSTAILNDIIRNI
jgi:regulator of sigma E protease